MEQNGEYFQRVVLSRPGSENSQQQHDTSSALDAFSEFTIPAVHMEHTNS